MTPRYILIQTGRNLKQTWGTQLMTLTTVSLSVFMFSFFFLVYINMLNTGDRLGDHIRLIVYLENEVVPELEEQLSKKIRQFSPVEKIVFKSRQDAFSDLSEQLNDDRDVLFSGKIEFDAPQFATAEGDLPLNFSTIKPPRNEPALVSFAIRQKRRGRS